MSFKQVCSRLWTGSTTATKITAVRILLIPFIILFYVGGATFTSDFFHFNGRLIALILFTVALATDWLDGQIAKRFNQQSKQGEWLDAFADKLLVITGLLLVFTDPFLNHDDLLSIIPMMAGVFAALAIIGSDMLGGTIKNYARTKDLEFKCGLLCKIKLAFQFSAIFLFMLFAVNYRPTGANLFFESGTGETIFTYLAWTAMTVAAVLSIINVVWLSVLYFKSTSEEVVEDAGEVIQD